MGKTKKITNTEVYAKTKEGATALLAEVMFSPTPGAVIKRMEADGQAELSQVTDRLPSKHLAPNVKPVLESAGVKFGNTVAEDPIWQVVELPNGWKIERTDHSMWSDLVDQNGRPRAAIFYKAAFYDRHANISVCTRYKPSMVYSDKTRIGLVLDGDKEIWRSEPFVDSPEYTDLSNNSAKYSHLTWQERDAICRTTAHRKAGEAARSWLMANKPDWENPSAYWDV